MLCLRRRKSLRLPWRCRHYGVNWARNHEQLLSLMDQTMVCPTSVQTKLFYLLTNESVRQGNSVRYLNSFSPHTAALWNSYQYFVFHHHTIFPSKECEHVPSFSSNCLYYLKPSPKTGWVILLYQIQTWALILKTFAQFSAC